MVCMGKFINYIEYTEVRIASLNPAVKFYTVTDCSIVQ